MILFISDRNDLQTYTVGHFLRKWEAPFLQINTADFPLASRLALGVDAGASFGRFRANVGATVDLTQVRSVWYRKPEPPTIAEDLAADEAAHAFEECRQGIQSLYNVLDDRLWISPVHTIRRAGNKLLQLMLARRLGFVVPDTLVTNDPDDAWDFHRRHGGNIVYKALGFGFLEEEPIPWKPSVANRVIYTTHLGGSSRQDLDLLCNAPGILQAYQPKLHELRVTVVGNEVFSAKILSQQLDEARVDWRKGLNEVSYERETLSEEVAERCRALVALLGLQYGAIDLIVRPDGEHVFLEINPNGQFGWIEDRLKLPISEAIARLLIGEAPPLAAREA